MTWRGRSELPSDTRRGEFAEQILIEITLGIAFQDGKLIDGRHGHRRQRRLVDHALGVLEVARQVAQRSITRFAVQQSVAIELEQIDPRILGGPLGLLFGGSHAV